MYLTGIYPMDDHVMGVNFIGVRLMGGCLISVPITSDVYLRRVPHGRVPWACTSWACTSGVHLGRAPRACITGCRWLCLVVRTYLRLLVVPGLVSHFSLSGKLALGPGSGGILSA
jgi:hypothetical protein